MRPAQRIADHDDEYEQDSIVVLHNVPWVEFERILAVRGEKARPRLAYLEGELQLMTPTWQHEGLGYMIGRLLEVWCLDRGVDFSGFGSWTLKNKRKKRGVEADECYVFGRQPNRRRPDLAIEVVWTSGGVDKLEIYRKLGVPEVWFWRRGAITVHLLRGEDYEESVESGLLPGLDLAQLASFLDRPIASEAMREYRNALKR